MSRLIEFGLLLSLSDIASPKLAAFNSNLQKIGSSDPFKNIGGGLDKFNEKLKKTSDNLLKFGAGAELIGQQTANLIKNAGKEFIEQDDALTRLKISMLDRNGKVKEGFGELSKLIIDLGNELPGETTNYANVATAMKNSGIEVKDMLDGGLRAASYMRVMFNMADDTAGSMVANLGRAFGLTGKELPKMADQLARAANAFNLTPEQIKDNVSYSASTAHVLNLKGEKSAREALIIQGIGRDHSMAGSHMGTGWKDLLDRTASMQTRLKLAKKGLKGHAAHMVKEAGADFNFYDKKGSFIGQKESVYKLEDAYNKIHKKYGQQGTMEVFHGVWGEQAGNVALTLAQSGRAGWADAEKRFDEQASLNKKMEVLLNDWRNVWGALDGTWKNAKIAMMQPAMDSVKPYITQLNTGVGVFQGWVEKHKDGFKVLVSGIALFSGLAIAIGAASLAFGVMGKIARVPIWMLSKVLGKSKVGMALSGLSSKLAAQKVFVVNWPLSMGGKDINEGGSGGKGKGKVGADRLETMRNAANGAALAGDASTATKLGRFARMRAGLSGLVGRLGGVGRVLNSPALGVLASAGGLLKSPAMALLRSSGRLVGRVGGLNFLFASMDAAAAYNSKDMTALQKRGAYGKAAGNLIGGAIGGTLGSVLGPIGTMVGGVLGSMLGGKIGEAIGKSKWLAKLLNPSLVQNLKKWGDGADTYFRSLAQRFVSWGGDIVSGLIRGLTGKMSSAWDAVKTLAGGIKDRFTAALGIKSPSRVFMGLGGFVSEGAALGIRSKSDLAARAAKAMAAGVIAAGSMHATAGAAGHGGGHAPVVIHFSPKITITGNASKQEVNAALTQSRQEFERMMNQWWADKQRTSFSN